jgi:hypothetical protein
VYYCTRYFLVKNVADVHRRQIGLHPYWIEKKIQYRGQAKSIWGTGGKKAFNLGL